MTADEGYPVLGLVDGKEATIAVLTGEELRGIQLGRGMASEPVGFRRVKKEMKKEDFEKAVKGLKCAEYPMPYREWERYGPKNLGRRRVTKTPTLATRIYYDREHSYLEEISGKESKYYTWVKEDVHPQPEEKAEYSHLLGLYQKFLVENNISIPLTSKGELMNSSKIISEWGDTEKVDVFSDITEEQRGNFVIARWIAVRIWFPDILTHIHGYLRLGHSVKGNLLDKQAETLRKTARPKIPEEEEGGWFKSPFQKEE